MNRFEDMLSALKNRGERDDVLQKVLSQLESLGPDSADDRSAATVRLPYSSDPTPIEDAWR